jgi:hypothetical protein
MSQVRAHLLTVTIASHPPFISLGLSSVRGHCEGKESRERRAQRGKEKEERKKKKKKTLNTGVGNSFLIF